MLLILGLLLFFATHSIALFGQREAVIAKLGSMGTYKIVVSILSLLAIILIAKGYESREIVQIWYPPVFLKHITFLLMLFAFVLLPATYLPSHIKTWVKHPMLTAVKAWSLGHLLVRGDLLAMIMFATFLAWAVVQRIVLKKRGDAGVSAAPKGWRNDAIVVVSGLALYIIFVLWLHPLLIGVALVPAMR